MGTEEVSSSESEEEPATKKKKELGSVEGGTGQ